MPIWLGITVGFLIGIVSGVTLIGVTISGGSGEWVTPTVIGPSIGAFLAAIVGLGGAVWSHYASIEDRNNERKKAAKRATLKLISAAINLLVFSQLHLRAWKRVAEEGVLDATGMNKLAETLKEVSQEFILVAEHDDIPPMFTVSAKNAVRLYISNDIPYEFDEAYMEATDPVQVLDEEKVYAAQFYGMLKTVDDSTFEVLKDWHNFVGVDMRLDELKMELERLIEQEIPEFLPDFVRM